jgi:hypothetical protein
MSYKNHVLVAALEKEETQDGPFDLSAFIAKERRHGSDIYAAFLEALAKKLPTCKFRKITASGSTIHVYLPTDHFVLGRVGWGDWSVDGKPTNSIMVQSPRITNDKYAFGEDAALYVDIDQPEACVIQCAGCTASPYAYRGCEALCH